MKISSTFRLSALLALGLIIAGARTEAQSLGLFVGSSANPIKLNTPLTYTINLTNLTGADQLIFITNTLPVSAVFQNDNVSIVGSVTNITNGATYDFIYNFTLPNAIMGQMNLTVLPTATGLITNSVVIASSNPPMIATASVITQVTNLTTQADLAVSMTGPNQTVITNDLVTYGVTVTNQGPNDAAGVVLSNTLPAGVQLIGISPSNQVSSTSNNVVFNLGTLPNGGFQSFQITVQPTTAGTATFSSSASAATNVVDPNLTNNSASINISVTNYFATLTVVTNSAQVYNPQNGLMEQSITVSNAGSSSNAVRVVVTGLTNFLANAVGTNGGNPFVVDAAPLNAGLSVNMLLQYYVPTRTPFPFVNSQLQAFAVPTPNFAAPFATAVSSNLNIYRIVELTNGYVLIEWPSTAGRTYTVVYSDNVLFSNAMIAPPAVTALANRQQWIDYGPPTTTNVPTGTSARFYRVFLNP